MGTHNARALVLGSLALLLCLLSWARPGLSKPDRPTSAPDAQLGAAPFKTVDEARAEMGGELPVLPFGSNLFLGNYQRQHQDGVNPEYVVMPGDRVVVNTWGTVEIKEVFIVDGQGNIFLPSIGPVALAGVKNKDLTSTLRRHIAKVYRSNFGVYTNLLTAAPVGVYVAGGVERPGNYAGVPSDSVLFYLNQAGGIDRNLGSYRDIVIKRDGKEHARIDLYDFLLEGNLPKMQFADGDTILVNRRGPVVHVKGAVASEVLIEFPKGDTLGAQALEVIPSAATATEVTVSGLRAGKPYAGTLSASEFSKAKLADGDVVEFRSDGLAEAILVRIEGEFYGPALITVKRGARLLDVLNHVKVDKELADLRSVHLRRRSVAQKQKRSIEDRLVRLERSALLALSSTQNEASIRLKEAELMKTFIETARNIQPLGRVVTSVRGQQRNLRLQDGDVVVIPPKSNVIRIGGEVQMTQAVIYRHGATAEEYIRAAGGYTERSDEDRVIILHASAEVTMGDGETFIRPGDEILVPPEVDTKLLQNASDITQVLYQIAVAAAVVIAL